MKLILPLTLTALLVGCGTPSTQKPLLERTLKRDTYYCTQTLIAEKNFERLKIIDKKLNIPEEDELFKKLKRNLPYLSVGGSRCETYPYPSTAYFKWIDLSTGKIYEETANLQEALEGLSVHNKKITFHINSNNKLFIYLRYIGIDPEQKSPEWPRDLQFEQIAPSQKLNKFWQLHPQPSPTKGLR